MDSTKLERVKEIWPDTWRDTTAFTSGEYADLYDNNVSLRTLLTRRDTMLDDIEEFIILHAWDTSVGHRIHDYITERRATTE